MIEELGREKESQWDAFVSAAPHASGYHFSYWASIFREVFRHEPCYLAAREKERVTGILPLVLMKSALYGRMAVAMPIHTYGGIVAETEAARDALLAAARSRAMGFGARVLELRQLDPLPDLPARGQKVTMWLDLAADEDSLWKQIGGKMRNHVRKAEKAGVTACTGGPELIGAFYAIYAHNMRDLGSPVFPCAMFERAVARHPGAEVTVCEWRGKPVAASITLPFRDRVEVPWASGLREHFALAPNNLLYWTMLRRAVERGARVFDFGRSTPDSGTYHFKAGWGARPIPLYWQYVLADASTELPDSSQDSPKYRAAVSLWKRLPVPITRVLGPAIVRHIP